jgi:hypothetical protein
MMIYMKILKCELIVFSILLFTSLIGACGDVTPVPIVTETVVVKLLSPTSSITPSPIPSITSLPMNTYTATPELDIAQDCKISDETGQLYLLSDQEFRDLRTTPGKLDQVLTNNYPEWANYTQMVPWSTQPVKLGEIIVSVSHDEESNLQINAAVTLVTLGDSLNWQLPSNTDIYLRSQEISTELNRLSFDWENPFDDSLRRQYPEVANSGTYALYAFFDYNLDRLQSWCNTYQKLFGNLP